MGHSADICFEVNILVIPSQQMRINRNEGRVTESVDSVIPPVWNVFRLNFRRPRLLLSASVLNTAYISSQLLLFLSNTSSWAREFYCTVVSYFTSTSVCPFTPQLGGLKHWRSLFFNVI